MSIRLNKAIRELNIGLQTAVEFLSKKSQLGEVKEDANFKLSDEQYQALVEEFQSDKETKKKAEALSQKKPKEKKRAPEVKENRAESLLESSNQHPSGIYRAWEDESGQSREENRRETRNRRNFQERDSPKGCYRKS